MNFVVIQQLNLKTMYPSSVKDMKPVFYITAELSLSSVYLAIAKVHELQRDTKTCKGTST